MTQTLPPLGQVIKAHGLSASKALGQNFLLDEQLLDRIAAIPGSLKGQQVYEVGPGPGGLTRALLRAGAIVTAVERDRRCLPILTDLAEAFPGQLHVIDDDAMKIDPAQEIGAPFHIASNLPYNVGTALAVGWLSASTWPPPWLSMTLMFQREVADRIVAPASTDAFGRLSVLSQWRSTAKIALPVHRSAFTPPPKIMSAIVHFTPAEQPEGASMATLEKLTGAAFGQRRKMLRQSLKGVNGALKALIDARIEADRRPETVTIAEWVALTKAMDAKS
jgi:16S rRNA (adenine1518-N6/adenine1519-N6)-dimethyltransferase